MKDPIVEKKALIAADRLSQIVLDAHPAQANVQMEITLVLPKKEGQDLRVGLRVGEEKLYVVRNIPEFLDAMETGKILNFGKGFEYHPDWMRFDEENMRVLRILQELTVSVTYGDTVLRGSELRLVYLPDIYTESLLKKMMKMKFRVMREDGSFFTCHGIREENLPLRFDMSLRPRGIHIETAVPEGILLTRSGSFMNVQNEIVMIKKNQRDLIRTMHDQQTEGICAFDYTLKDTEKVIGEVLPYLKLRGAVALGEDLQNRLVRRNLMTAVYLDRNGQSVEGSIRFRYGDTELNPFEPTADKITLDKGEKLLLRDAEAEKQVLDILEEAGFRVKTGHVLLSGQDAIFEFVNDGVRKLQECSEVYFSTEFRRIIPRRPVLTGSVRMNDNHLEMLLTVDGEPVQEVLSLMEALGRKRNYFRLKDGRFLDLTELGIWQETAEKLYDAAIQDGNSLNRDILVLQQYRACYLDSLLKESGLEVHEDEEVCRVARTLNGERAETPIPAVAHVLKEYQVRGYEWLSSLDRMHMGGILADDMGLGKTVQIIALLQSIHETGKTSLIVAPTSLTYNWYSEIKRFSPETSAMVLNGTAEQRENMIRHVLKQGDVEVLITSYPLIRRDIDLMKDYSFRTVILDEAQQIKNAGSVAAAAVKQLKADSRFALTGTPMENGVGELWSIFDFVLPGYLPGYNTFLRLYQDGENGEDLQKRIKPFLIRRLKQDVLTELPDKIETVMTAAMTTEQEKVYRASMMRIRPRIERMIHEKTFGQNRMEILAAITELRQICCHPSLVLDGYEGSSGKEEMLLDLLPAAVESGRRILLFSQFTGMLKILREHLNRLGYSTMYLDGDTPAGERLSMTETFNNGTTQVFLISLRAGGSGLNLTGADLVIHYDPWWNPATEEQATDRAHRIGQTKKVEVIRLVTGGSIEEQVVELGVRKKALFDRLITPGEEGINGLSEQDIRALFE